MREYYAAPVATATFSPNGSCGDLMSTCSLGVSDTGARVVAMPVDPFSVRGRSVVDWEDLNKR